MTYKFDYAENMLDIEKNSLQGFEIFEKIFNRIGMSVVKRPFTYILLSFILVALCATGFLKFKFEYRAEKQWTPTESDYVRTWEWRNANFPEMIRLQIGFLEGENNENILQPKFFKEIHRLNKLVADIEIQGPNGKILKLSDMCMKVPYFSKLKEHWLVRSLSLMEEGSDLDISLFFDTDTYCNIVDALSKTCFQLSLVDMWLADDELVANLTQEQIIHSINTKTHVEKYGFKYNFTELLGGVERNDSGHIVFARSTVNVWLMMVNETALESQESLELMDTDSVDSSLYVWEAAFIDALLTDNHTAEGVSILPHAKRSFNDVSRKALGADMAFLFVGTSVLLLYVMVMLGKFNMVEMRPTLSLMGFFSVIMSIIASFGLCSTFGSVFGSLHSFLPLIMLGLGVDDMFILAQTWQNLKKEDSFQKLDLDARLAKTLQKSGVAIFVTSLTDFVAFSIGTLSNIPALSSFCLYSAVGVMFLFITQITIFFACFALDQRRLEENRNGLLWCIKHRNWTPNYFSKIDLNEIVFTKIANLLMCKWVKVFVVVSTVALTVFSAREALSLRQDFDIIWFLPTNSYLYKILGKVLVDFPQVATEGDILLDSQSLIHDMDKLGWLVDELDSSPYILKHVAFYAPFVNYTMEDVDINLREDEVTSLEYTQYLIKFLHSKSGARYTEYISFDGIIACGVDDPPNLKAARIHYYHAEHETREEKIIAMDAIKDLVRSANFSGFGAATAPAYYAWETDKIIVRELIQNLSFALAAVFFMTSILIFNIKTSFLVFISVTITLIEVMALMSWWGLTIDCVTCINLVLSVGLSVDYSSHIGLHFMRLHGSREQRAKGSIIEIGPPVLNGALSTYLAFALLANCGSYFFFSFFKIFTGVFIFGVYNGLVVLPVLLSIVGPPAFGAQDTKLKKKDFSELEALN